jgi:hypothetical protein
VPRALPKVVWVRTSVAALIPSLASALGCGPVTEKPLRDFESNRGSIEIWEREARFTSHGIRGTRLIPTNPIRSHAATLIYRASTPDTDGPDALLAWGRGRWGSY